MAIVTSASFTGLDINRVRIDSTIRASDALAIARMQSHVWQRITATTGGGSLVATPHIHDGSNGAIIPIPLSCNHLLARIDRPGTDDRSLVDYAPVSLQPYYAAPGMTRVRVIGLGRTFSDLLGWRVRTFSHDASGYPTLYAESTIEAFLPGAIPSVGAGGLDAVPWYIDIDTPLATGAGASPWFSLEVAAWDGLFWDEQSVTPGSTGPPEVRWLDDVIVLPVPTPGVNRDAAIPFTQAGIHAAATHLGVEETLVGTDRALASFVVDRMARNDISNAAALLTHTHGQDPARLGTVFRQPLLSHGLGVMRRHADSDAAQIVTDQIITQGWNGRVHAPCRTATSTDAAPVAHTRFQLPPGDTDDLGIGGAGSRMQCAMLVNYVTNCTVSAQIFDGDFANGGGAVSSSILSSAGTGRRLVVLDEIKCASTALGEGEDQTLVLTLKRDAAAVSSRSIGLYGYSLAVTE